MKNKDGRSTWIEHLASLAALCASALPAAAEVSEVRVVKQIGLGLAVRVGPVTQPGLVRLLHAPDLALRPHSGGLLHLEAEDAAAAVDLHTPEPDVRRWAAELLHRARRTVRGLDDAQVVKFKVCVRPLPADEQSIVGRLPGAPGIYVAVTHSGVTLAAHLSRLITADLTTGTPPAPLTSYTPARFLPGIQ